MTILILAAHPDDEILGCGGTVARLIKEGEEAFAVILGEGITSRSGITPAAAKKDLAALHKKSRESASIIGISDTRCHNLPDNRFDTVALLDIVKIIEKEIDRVRPDLIFTHHGGDLNIDHALVFRAVLTASRPIKDTPVREVYGFAIPSSTDWAFCHLSPPWKPDTFYDISDTLETKIRALEAYDSEMRSPPHPRSYDNIRNTAYDWGAVSGTRAAEAFELIRALK